MFTSVLQESVLPNTFFFYVARLFAAIACFRLSDNRDNDLGESVGSGRGEWGGGAVAGHGGCQNITIPYST